jgi:hypothetical protein
MADGLSSTFSTGTPQAHDVVMKQNERYRVNQRRPTHGAVGEMEEFMKAFHASTVAAGFALSLGIPAANAQTLIEQPATETVIVETTQTPVVPTRPLARSRRVSQTTETRRVISPAPARRVTAPAPVASTKTTTVRRYTEYNYPAPLYDMVPAPRVQTVAPEVVVAPTPGQIFPASQVLNVSGQFRCVSGCIDGLGAPTLVTQNGWDLNVVNGIGQSSRAWIDRPGHIWVQSWNEGAIYSPDGMTIQFDNGVVWRRDVALVVPSE